MPSGQHLNVAFYFLRFFVGLKFHFSFGKAFILFKTLFCCPALDSKVFLKIMADKKVNIDDTPPAGKLLISICKNVVEPCFSSVKVVRRNDLHVDNLCWGIHAVVLLDRWSRTSNRGWEASSNVRTNVVQWPCRGAYRHLFSVSTSYECTCASCLAIVFCYALNYVITNVLCFLCIKSFKALNCNVKVHI